MLVHMGSGLTFWPTQRGALRAVTVEWSGKVRLVAKLAPTWHQSVQCPRLARRTHLAVTTSLSVPCTSDKGPRLFQNVAVQAGPRNVPSNAYRNTWPEKRPLTKVQGAAVLATPARTGRWAEKLCGCPRSTPYARLYEWPRGQRRQRC
eukprot:scaffold1243_cov403-Prasinococcus_capsulatus_cf.AAC.5